MKACLPLSSLFLNRHSRRHPGLQRKLFSMGCLEAVAYLYMVCVWKCNTETRPRQTDTHAHKHTQSVCGTKIIAVLQILSELGINSKTALFSSAHIAGQLAKAAFGQSGSTRHIQFKSKFPLSPSTFLTQWHALFISSVKVKDQANKTIKDPIYISSFQVTLWLDCVLVRAEPCAFTLVVNKSVVHPEWNLNPQNKQVPMLICIM